MGYFAVRLGHGPGWVSSRGIREQDAWDEHAAFMDGLVEDGLVYLGGPLGNGDGALLIVEASGEEEIRRRLAEDPWAPPGLLVVSSVETWSVWLDGRRGV